MYHKRLIPVAGGVYRPLPVRRYVMKTMGGFWPVLQRLPDGRLGVVTRDGDFHIGERGRLVFVTSSDGGESWSHDTVISAAGPDNRNPAFGVSADGALIAAFIKADRYLDGDWSPEKDPGGYTATYVSRSEDGGANWGRGEWMAGQELERWSGVHDSGPNHPNAYSSPFGKMITLPDGVIVMAHKVKQTSPPTKAATVAIRSRDGGRSWVEPALIAEGFTEPALCYLGDGRLLAMLRSLRNGEQRLCQSDSDDMGYTWSTPRPVTDDQEFPGDVIRLQDGRLLLTYGRRVPPFGVQGMLSSDDGNTWDTDNKLLLVGDVGGRDCGYPSSVQLDDGTIVTVYDAWSIIDDPRMGVHGGALLYRPEDL